MKEFITVWQNEKQVRVYNDNANFLSFAKKYKEEHTPKEIKIPSSSCISLIEHFFPIHLARGYTLVAVLKDEKRQDCGRYRLLLVK